MVRNGQLRERIVGLLRERATVPLSAGEIRRHLAASGLQVTKSDVNKVLYRDSQFQPRDTSTPPRWVLINGDPTAGLRVVSTAPEPAGRRSVRLQLPLRAWQSDALERWRASGRRGVVEAVTGSGKSVVGLEAVAEALRQGGRAVVLVPSLPLIDQWLEDFADRLPMVRAAAMSSGRDASLREVDVIVATVQTACRRSPLEGFAGLSLLVADECHRYGSESFAVALDERYGARLGLTATYERNDDGRETWLDPFFGGSVFELGYERALAEGVVAPFRVALVGVDFTAEERQGYEAADATVRSLSGKLLGNGLPSQPFGEFIKQTQRLAAGKPATDHARKPDPRLVGIARGYLNAFSKRRQQLADTAVKREVLNALAPLVRASSGTLVFTETVSAAVASQALLERHGLRAAALHSGLSHSAREAVLERFGKHELDVVTAPRVLDEGIDVPEAELGIMLAGSRTRRQMIQRMGRVLRRKQDGRIASFVITYVRATGEDPAVGAHEGFLDEVTRVAKDLRVFDKDVDPAELRQFLRPHTRVEAGRSAASATREPVLPASPPRRVAPESSAVSDSPGSTVAARPRSIEDGRPPPVVLQLLMATPTADRLRQEHEARNGWLTSVEFARFRRWAEQFGHGPDAYRAVSGPLPRELQPQGAFGREEVMSTVRTRCRISIGYRCAQFLTRAEVGTNLSAVGEHNRQRSAKIIRELEAMLHAGTDHLVQRNTRGDARYGQPTVWQLHALAKLQTHSIRSTTSYRLPSDRVDSLLGDQDSPWVVLEGSELLRLLARVRAELQILEPWFSEGERARRLIGLLVDACRLEAPAPTPAPATVRETLTRGKRHSVGKASGGDHVLNEIEERWRDH